MESPKKLTGQHPKERKMFELKINGKHTNNPVEVANAFSQYFINSVAAIAQTFPPVSLKISQINTTEPAFNLQNVTETKVAQIIKSIKTSRATDVYGMDTSMLKELGITLAYTLTKLINQSFTQGTCPSVWKSAAVISKNGDPLSVNNYRPISILPTISKVAEKLIAQQISGYLNTSPFSLHPMQFGFRANYSKNS